MLSLVMLSLFLMHCLIWCIKCRHYSCMPRKNFYLLQNILSALKCFSWTEGLSKTASIPHKIEVKVCVHSPIHRPHLWDYTGYLIVVLNILSLSVVCCRKGKNSFYKVPSCILHNSILISTPSKNKMINDPRWCMNNFFMSVTFLYWFIEPK